MTSYRARSPMRLPRRLCSQAHRRRPSRGDGGFGQADGMLTERWRGRSAGKIGLAGIGSLAARIIGRTRRRPTRSRARKALSAADHRQGARDLCRPFAPHGAGGALGQGAVRQRLEGDQCRRGRQGARELHRHLLDHRRRPKAGGLAGLEPFFPRIARAYLIGEPPWTPCRQLGGEGRSCPMRHARPRHRGGRRRCAAVRRRTSRSCCCRRLAPPTISSPISRRGRSFRDLVMRLPASPVQPKAGQGGMRLTRADKSVLSGLVVHRRPPDVLRPAAAHGRRPCSVARRKPADRRQVRSRAVLFRAPSGGAALASASHHVRRLDADAEADPAARASSSSWSASR